MRLDEFWSTERWRAYERAYGDPPGARAALLATAPWLTRVVDLQVTQEELWRGVRRSYHALINRLRRDPAFRIYDAEPIDVISLARRVHIDSAGRETRPIDTWWRMTEWVRNQQALCALASRDGQAVGFAYAIQYRNWAYYGFGASHEPNVQHALQWHVMRALQGRGVRWYETGWQGQATDPKGLSIEMFRRGWGGRDYGVRDIVSDSDTA